MSTLCSVSAVSPCVRESFLRIPFPGVVTLGYMPSPLHGLYENLRLPFELFDFDVAEGDRAVRVFEADAAGAH